MKPTLFYIIFFGLNKADARSFLWLTHDAKLDGLIDETVVNWWNPLWRIYPDQIIRSQVFRTQMLELAAKHIDTGDRQSRLAAAFSLFVSDRVEERARTTVMGLN